MEDKSVEDTCAICLGSFSDEIGSPELCDHCFCLECIVEWSKNNNSCPQDRIPFLQIFVRKAVGGKIFRKIPINEAVPSNIPEDDNEEMTFCQVCGRCDREDVLLLCDGCDDGYHLDCLVPSLENVPLEEWFCRHCQAAQRQRNEVNELQDVPLSSRMQNIQNRRQRRLLPRTQESERIRARINRARQSIRSNEVGEPSGSGTRRKKKRTRVKKRRKTVKRLKKNGVKGKGKKRVGKRKVKKKPKGIALQTKCSTPKSRIARTLGLIVAKNSKNLQQPLIKAKKNFIDTLTSRNSSFLDYSTNIPRLNLLGSNSDLDVFAEADEYGDSLLAAAVQRRSESWRDALHRRKLASMTLSRAAPRKICLTDDLPQSVTILDDIIGNQTALYCNRKSPAINSTVNNRTAGTGTEETSQSGSYHPTETVKESHNNTHHTENVADISTSHTSPKSSQDPNGTQAYLSYLQGCKESQPTVIKKKKLTQPEEDVNLYSDIEPENDDEFSLEIPLAAEAHSEDSSVDSAEELFIDENVNKSNDGAMKNLEFEAVSDNDSASANGSISLSDSNAPENENPPQSIGLDRLEVEVISDSEEMCFVDSELIEEGEIPAEPSVKSLSAPPKQREQVTHILTSNNVTKTFDADYEEGEIIDDKRVVPISPVKPQSPLPVIEPTPIVVEKFKRQEQCAPNVAANEEPTTKKVDVLFKKMSKSSKVRNYRDSDKQVDKRTSTKRPDKPEKMYSKEKGRKLKSRKSKTREPKRKEMERYNVRDMISKKEQERKKKDEFGRDVSLRDVIKRSKSSRRRSHSSSRKRSRSKQRSSRNRTKRKRRRSRSSSSSYSSSSCSSCTSSRSTSSSSSSQPLTKSNSKSHEILDIDKVKSVNYDDVPTDENRCPTPVKELKESEKKRKKKKVSAPSKEVFQAGGSIMISVNFSKPNDKGKTEPVKKGGTVDVQQAVNNGNKESSNIVSSWSGRPSSSPGKRTPLQDEPMWSPENETHLMNDVNTGDLDIIMVTPPPQEPILISDSDEEPITLLPPDLGNPKSNVQHKNQGPKTPPEPSIKFTLSTKQNLKPITNPLQDEELEEALHARGPNTPPGAPPESDESGRAKSPALVPLHSDRTHFSGEIDVYDPFDPTKSPSSGNSPQEAKITSSGQIDPQEPTAEHADLPSSSPPPLPINPPPVSTRPPEPQKLPEHEISTSNTIESAVASNNLHPTPNHTKKPPNPIDAAFAGTVTALDPMQQLFAGLPANIAAALAAATVREVPPTLMMPRSVFPVTDFSKPPPILQPVIEPAAATTNAVTDMELASPTSPGSSDVSEIFEPPSSSQKDKPTPNRTKASDRFDAVLAGGRPSLDRHKAKRPHNAKGPVKPVVQSTDEEIPTSAVDLQVKEKLLKKVQRQERVVEEVKVSLKPFYNKKTISKADYKDIMKKCVQKVCHNRSGEINPIKIRALVEAYIKKVKYYRKKNEPLTLSSKKGRKSDVLNSKQISLQQNSKHP